MLLWVSANLQQRICIWLQSGDEGVALESCEFWSAFCEAAVSQPDRLNPEVLRPFLGRLVPVLLKNMVRTICAIPVLQSLYSCVFAFGDRVSQQRNGSTIAILARYTCLVSRCCRYPSDRRLCVTACLAAAGLVDDSMSQQSSIALPAVGIY